MTHTYTKDWIFGLLPIEQEGRDSDEDAESEDVGDMDEVVEDPPTDDDEGDTGEPIGSK